MSPLSFSVVLCAIIRHKSMELISELVSRLLDPVAAFQSSSASRTDASHEDNAVTPESIYWESSFLNPKKSYRQSRLASRSQVESGWLDKFGNTVLHNLPFSTLPDPNEHRYVYPVTRKIQSLYAQSLIPVPHFTRDIAEKVYFDLGDLT